MCEIDREGRKKETQEYFTQKREIDEILRHWSDEQILQNETFLDNSCGSGNILFAILQRKLALGITLEDALPTLFGVDFEISNVEECRTRLIMGREDLRHIVEQNIVCADGLRYHYRFDGSPPYDLEPPKGVIKVTNEVAELFPGINA
jgi:hypothetical protein